MLSRGRPRTPTTGALCGISGVSTGTAIRLGVVHRAYIEQACGGGLGGGRVQSRSVQEGLLTTRRFDFGTVMPQVRTLRKSGRRLVRVFDSLIDLADLE